MKTNVTLYSKDRVLFGVTIRQETRTGFLNISDLQESYTRERIINGWADKNLTSILMARPHLERIYYIMTKQDLITLSLGSFIEEVEKQGVAKTLKKYKAYKTTGARKNKAVWCNPYIWVMIALELNPKLYAEVMMWLTDKLILNRIEAGSFYVELSKAIGTFDKPDWQQIAKAMNIIVFGKHTSGIRNTGTEIQLKELRDLEVKLAWAINMGYITSQEKLLEELRKIYHNKYPNGIAA